MIKLYINNHIFVQKPTLPTLPTSKANRIYARPKPNTNTKIMTQPKRIIANAEGKNWRWSPNLFLLTPKTNSIKKASGKWHVTLYGVDTSISA